MHIKRVRHNTWYPKIIQCEKDVPLIFQHQPFILNPCWGTSILGKPARAKVRVDHQDFGKGQDLSQFTVNTWPNGISRRWLDMAYTYHLQKLWFGGSFKILWPCFTHITILYHAQAPSHLYHLQSAVIEPCCTPSLPNCYVVFSHRLPDLPDSVQPWPCTGLSKSCPNRRYSKAACCDRNLWADRSADQVRRAVAVMVFVAES